MKLCKTIPAFILLFTGCCVKNMQVAAVESEGELSTTALPTTYSTQAFHIPTSDDFPDSGGPVAAGPTLPPVFSSPLSDFRGEVEVKTFPGSDIPTPSTAATINSSLLVAGLSISFVLFSVCVIIGVWNARRLSKQYSFDVTPAPSGEA